MKRKSDLESAGGIRFLWLALVFMAPLSHLRGQVYRVTTFAGYYLSTNGADGIGTAASFNTATAVVVDALGNSYVADTFSSTIRKVTPSGAVTTVAGIAGIAGNVDGVGNAARFSTPFGLAIDVAGAIYVADTGNSKIRKITLDGKVTTFAGADARISGSLDGLGSAARFSFPQGLAVDASGTVYVADTGNHTIRKITAAGLVSTLAGSAGLSGSADGTGSAAHFSAPQSVALDSSGNLVICEANSQAIRKISSARVVTTFAGSAGVAGSVDGIGTAARFSSPFNVTVDPADNIFVADSRNYTIRKITPAGVVTTVAGQVGSPGVIDGAGNAARFSLPSGIAATRDGQLFVADGNTIRKVFLDIPVTAQTVNEYEFSTLAGQPGLAGSADGIGAAARFNGPNGIALDPSGNLMVADTGNRTIRKITPTGAVSTFAGMPGSAGTADGAGLMARFNRPVSITVDPSGNTFVCDEDDFTVRKIPSDGVVSTFAGKVGSHPVNLDPGDGVGLNARFNLVSAIAIDNVE